MDLVVDAAVIGVVPGLVEVLKRAGMPIRFAGLAAIILATLLIAMGEIAQAAGDNNSVAGWILRGMVTGLAASGLYSQANTFRNTSK